jgi:tripartite-type tricarboxylate transporter receptor subunit TctC
MRSLTGTVGALCLILAAIASAQTYPNKPITLVIPFSPGGGVDYIARAVGPPMSQQWGQPVVYLNRAGAGTTIGAASVAHAAPDGYTLFVGSAALTISPSLYKELSYDLLKDLAPITQLAEQPNLLVVHPSVPAQSVQELVALAKANPGKLKSASAGVGSSDHVALVLFNSLAGVDIKHVPYKGGAPAVADLLGGHVDMDFQPITTMLPLVQAGKLRVLAVTTARRSSALPQVPPLAEMGLPGYAVGSWTGLLAPAGTPRPIIDKIHAAAVESLRSPAVKQAFANAGVDAVTNTPEEFSQILREELAKWGKVLQTIGKIE